MKRGRPRKYATPEESKAANLERANKKYTTVYGRAYILSKRYEQTDMDANRGKSTITPDWIIGNIFASKCYWCGETDWKQLGCDRIDNTKPHTPDNVICSCGKCNRERNKHSMDYFHKYQISKSTAPVQLTLF